jgi:hypothetical protein
MILVRIPDGMAPQVFEIEETCLDPIVFTDPEKRHGLRLKDRAPSAWVWKGRCLGRSGKGVSAVAVTKEDALKMARTLR